MQIREFYQMIQGDYEGVFKRLYSDELIEKMIRKFAADTELEHLLSAQKEEDISAAFRASHNIKGVAATLGFTKLYDVVVPLVEELRPLTKMAESELFEKVKVEYKQIQDAIEQMG